MKNWNRFGHKKSGGEGTAGGQARPPEVKLKKKAVSMGCRSFSGAIPQKLSSMYGPKEAFYNASFLAVVQIDFSCIEDFALDACPAYRSYRHRKGNGHADASLPGNLASSWQPIKSY